jgi:hypothetical protein
MVGQRRRGIFGLVAAITNGERQRRQRGAHKFSRQASRVPAVAWSRGRQGEESPKAAVEGEVLGRHNAGPLQSSTMKEKWSVGFVT